MYMKKNNFAVHTAAMLLFASAVMLSAKQSFDAEKAPVQPGKRWIIDTIIARVNGVNILKSDLEKPQIGKEGGLYTVDELIGEELIFQRAQEKHLLPNSSDIERQIVSFKMQLNLAQATDEQFEEHLKAYGFTLKEYKNQLGRMLAINNCKQAEISEKVLVTSQEVEDYHKQNPTQVKEKFHLAMTLLNEDNVGEYKDLIDKQELTWKDLGFIETDEIDQQFLEATRLQVGEITKPIKKNKKYVLIKLIEKQESRLLSLNECYGDIEKTLQQTKRETFTQSFQEELRRKAFIFYP